MDRRKFITTGAILLSGCTGLSRSDGEDIQDSDGDGRIDSEDYAPNDPGVQEKSDLQSTATETETRSPTPTDTPTPSPTSTEPHQLEVETMENTPIPDSDGDGISDAVDEFPNDSEYTEKYAEEEGEKFLTPGEYWYWKWSQNNERTLEWFVEVTEGSSIDVVVIDEHEFSDFESSEEYEYYVYGSDLETMGATKKITLDAGDYRLILSNWSVDEDESSQVEYEYIQAS